MGALLIVGIASLAFGLLGLGWFLLVPAAGARARNNLERGGRRPRASSERAERTRRHLLPATSSARLVTLAEASGRTRDAADTAATLKFVLAGIALLLALLLGVGSGSPLGWLLGAGLVVLAWFAPEIYLSGRAGDRRKLIDAALADTLDQLTIAVEAGLAFETALQRVVRNGSGPLNDELARTLQAMQLGVTRRDAYRALADRVRLPDLERFTRAITQADAYGVPIASVLRVQSAEVRMRRRQRLEEQAMKIPVKVTFPLMLCLMPVLFIMILGPVLINALGGL